MSILIKGVKMPDCWNCPCLDGEYGECNILGKTIKGGNGRRADCPLIELPGHGDLIDKDELSRLVGESFEYFLARLGLKCPKAIIPAERSEE